MLRDYLAYVAEGILGGALTPHDLRQTGHEEVVGQLLDSAHRQLCPLAAQRARKLSDRNKTHNNKFTVNFSIEKLFLVLDVIGITRLKNIKFHLTQREARKDHLNVCHELDYSFGFFVQKPQNAQFPILLGLALWTMVRVRVRLWPVLGLISWLMLRHEQFDLKFDCLCK